MLCLLPVVKTNNHDEDLFMDLLRIIIAIILPPLGVFMQVGFAGAFWLNILLTLLGYIPGIIHAIWIIARR
ncbi:putative membrane protein [Duffyella gerundensis]|uniref:Putative membrane protein n=2 Tax=Erwiniaceae TaxID=1903409 RepID=A0A0U5GNU4_9GAMM|nr:putative membrane protein [Duffyella gerundensis]